MGRRPGTAALDTSRIAAAALAVLDKHGLDGFTTRAVAKQLRVTPMALYHHVRDKAELAALVVELATLEDPLADLSGDWREDLWEVARWTREVSLSHPNVHELRRLYRVWTPSMLLITERWLVLWRQSGLDSDQALFAAATCSQAVTGLVAEEAVYRNMDAPSAELLAKLPNARKLLRSRHDPEAAFELAVRSLIEGLHANLSRPQSKKKAAAKRKRRI